MNKHILWVEDDYFAIKGLVRPLEREGFEIDVARSATEAFQKAQNWQAYDLILVDLILPLSNDPGPVPEEVRSWDNEQYVGLGIVKWLKQELKVTCPVLILSVVRQPISKFHLEGLGLAGHLPKRGLLPHRVKEEVLGLLGIKA